VVREGPAVSRYRVAVTDAPALAWIQPDPDSDDERRQFVVIGIRAGGNDGERVVQEVMLGAYQADEDTYAILPDDLACEITPAEGAVTVHLTTRPQHLAALARQGEEWRQRAARLLPEGPPPQRVRLLTATVPRPEGLADLAPGVVVIDFEHGDSPEDVLDAVRDGQSAYTLVGPDTAAAPLTTE
jgi:hypothetical protein